MRTATWWTVVAMLFDRTSSEFGEASADLFATARESLATGVVALAAGMVGDVVPACTRAARCAAVGAAFGAVARGAQRVARWARV